jgi:hypothetical protein
LSVIALVLGGATIASWLWPRTSQERNHAPLATGDADERESAFKQ